MTGQLALALDLDPPPTPRRRRGTVRCYVAPMRRPYMWWRGHRREVTNVPVTIGGVL